MLSRLTLLVLTLHLFSPLIQAAPFEDSFSVKRQADEWLPPSKDPWYQAPPGYERAAPGTILKTRVAPGNLSQIYNAAAVHSILYRTTDSNHKPSWAVTTLFVPPVNATGHRTANSTGLVSYQVPYDSAFIDAGPSYGYFLLQKDTVLTLLLNQYGYCVSASDYEGPLASFGSGTQSGHGVLDSVRAVLNSGRCARPGGGGPRHAMMGYSGGAFASAWAAELQAKYAPELAFAGMAIGGLPTNLTAAALVNNQSPFSALIPEVLLGITSQDPPARRYLLDQLRPDGPFNATYFLRALTEVIDINRNPLFTNQDIWQFFRDGVAILRAAPLRNLFQRDNYLGFHGVPRMPVLATHAVHDQVVPIADTDRTLAHYCARGANILYQRNSVGGHLAESQNSLARSAAFLAAVLSGTYESRDAYKTRGCTIQNITDASVTSSPL